MLVSFPDSGETRIIPASGVGVSVVSGLLVGDFGVGDNVGDSVLHGDDGDGDGVVVRVGVPVGLGVADLYPGVPFAVGEGVVIPAALGLGVCVGRFVAEGPMFAVI